MSSSVVSRRAKSRVCTDVFLTRLAPLKPDQLKERFLTIGRSKNKERIAPQNVWTMSYSRQPRGGQIASQPSMFNRSDRQATILSRTRCFRDFLLCRNLGDRYRLL